MVYEDFLVYGLLPKSILPRSLVTRNCYHINSLIDDVNCDRVQFLAGKASWRPVLPLSLTDSLASRGGRSGASGFIQGRAERRHAAERRCSKLPPLLHILPFSAKRGRSPSKLSS